MKITVSFLKSKLERIDTIKNIEDTDADYIHVDVMDGIFVDNKVLSIEELNVLFINAKKPLDIHLMCVNPKEYIDGIKDLPNIKYITVHSELGDKVIDLIDYIHSLGYKAGVALNPETPVPAVEKYIDKVDYFIIMGVHPGAGGQSLIPETVDKVKVLKELRDVSDFKYEICLDGGVNLETRPFLNNCDVLVSGSFICMSDNYQNSVNALR